MGYVEIESSSSGEEGESHDGSDQSVGGPTSTGKRPATIISPDGQYAKKALVYSRRGHKPVPSLKRPRRSAENYFDCGYGLHFDDIRNRRGIQFQRFIKSLNPQQRMDVKAIGFGGLLEADCDRMPDQMNEWLIDCFCPVSQYFEVRGKIRFGLTDLDARRVFGLTYSQANPVVYDRHDGATLSILSSWKRRYGIPRNLILDIDDAHSVLCLLEKGGDDFKRLFVLYAMKMLLKPDFGTYIEVGLLKSLIDVDGIKYLDWAGHVVSHLCSSILGFKKKPTSRGCQGCLLLLQLTYFHSTIWRGIELPTMEPLIRHWGETKVGERVMEELLAGGFGRGLFKKMKYVEDEVQPRPAIAMGSPSVPRKLDPNDPMTIWSHDQLSDAIADPSSRQTWHVLSDVERVIRSHSQRVGSELQLLRDYCFSNQCEDKVTFDARLGFDMVVNNLLNVCCSMKPEMRIPGRFFYSDSNVIVDGGSYSDELQLRPWLKWEYNYPAIFASDLLQKCSTLCHDFPLYQLEIADYCISRGDLRVPIFHDGCNVWLDSSDFLTLDLKQPLKPSIVNAYARVLNYDWFNHEMTTRVCLGVVTIDGDSVSNKSLVSAWKEWLTMNQAKLHGAAFVFIPVVVFGNYSLFVVNFLDQKIQCVDCKHNETGQSQLETRGGLIGNAFAQLMEVLLDDRVEEFRTYMYEHITPHWTSSGGDTDGGVCVMNMMEKFTGSVYGIQRLRLNESHKQIQLRVAYACFIALSKVNNRRLNVIDEAGEFIAMKANRDGMKS